MTAPSLRPHDSLGRSASPRERLHRVAFAKGIPLTALVELTSRCNLRCIHCYGSRQSDSTTERELPTDRLVALMAELAGEGCLSVSLTGGEIGLRRGWADIAWAAKRSRMAVTLLSNGTVFTAEDIAEIRRLRVRKVCVSLYGASADLHDAVTHVEGSFETTLATIRALREAGVRCRLGTVLMKENDGEYKETLSLARELGCAFRADPTVFPRADGRTDVLEQRIPVERLRGFYSDSDVAPECLEGLLVDGIVAPARPSVRNCGAGITTTFVSATGRVFPCVGFEPPFGSVADADFHTVWRGSAAVAHRSLMARPLAGCSECGVSTFCTQRCARNAQIEDGSPVGPSARACEVAHLLYDMHAEGVGRTAVEVSAQRGDALKKPYVKPMVESEPAFETLSGCVSDATDGYCIGQGLSQLNET